MLTLRVVRAEGPGEPVDGECELAHAAASAAASLVPRDDRRVLRADGEVMVFAEGGQGWALDLGTGEVRDLDRDVFRTQLRVGEAAIERGASVNNGEVQVDVDAGELVVREASTGEELWTRRVTSDRPTWVHLGDETVILTQESRRLPLHEWFAPQEGTSQTLEILGARTGSRLVTARYTEHAGVSHVVYVGDHVLVGVPDDQGRYHGRIITG